MCKVSTVTRATITTIKRLSLIIHLQKKICSIVYKYVSRHLPVSFSSIPFPSSHLLMSYSPWFTFMRATLPSFVKLCSILIPQDVKICSIPMRQDLQVCSICIHQVIQIVQSLYIKPHKCLIPIHNVVQNWSLNSKV